MNNSQLKKQLENAFTPPPAQNKSTFLENINYPKASKLSFLITQMGHISRLFWWLSALAAVAMFGMIQLYRGSAVMIGLLSSCLPFMTLIGITELQRSTTYGMAEMESCCKHSFAQITLVRLTIIGIVHAIILVMFCMLCINRIGITPMRTVLYLVTPFLLCTCLSLAVLLHLRSRETLYICGCITGAVVIATIMASSLSVNIYADKFTVIWVIGAFALVVPIVLNIRKIIKHTEDIQWNSSLTA